MLVRNKWVCILFIIVGIIIALSNAYLFWIQQTAWDAIMFLVGLGWIWLGTSNLRRLQKADGEQ